MINFRKKSRKRWRTLQKQDRGAKPREQSTAFQGAKISYDAFQGANSLVERVAISHTSKQGAKLKARCEIPCSRCEFPKCHFCTPLYKVRKPLLTHECHFRTPQAKFRTVRNKVQNFCIVRNWVWNWFQGAKSPVQSANSLNVIFAHHYSRCENFRTVRNPLLAHECHFRTPQAHFRTVRNWVRNWFQGAKTTVQRVPFSHTQIQGAKFLVQGAKISHGKILSSKNFKLTFKLKFYPRNCA